MPQGGSKLMAVSCWIRCGLRYTGAFSSLRNRTQRSCWTCSGRANAVVVCRAGISTSERRPQSDQSGSGTNGYGAEQIQVLEGLDPVRKRPGMYIGSTGQRGLHHLLFEVLDNAMDEVQAGFATDVRVQLDTSTGAVCVQDNGRGIPTELHPHTGRSALETVLTVLHAGGKFGGGGSGYTVSGGLHGVGVSVVNALSEWLEVTVWRGGLEHVQEFSRGEPSGDMAVTPLGGGDTEKTGTQVRFRYDPSVFSKGASFDPEAIRSRLRELAFLNSKSAIHYQVSGGSSQEGDWLTFQFGGGLKEYVQYINRDNNPLHEPLVFRAERDGVEVEVGLQWCSDAFSDTVLGYANNIKTIDGGSHLEGFRTALTRTINALARKHKLLKEGDANMSGDFVREGLAAIVSVKVPDPEFEGQTKTRLGNPGVRKIVDQIVSEEVSYALELDLAALQSIFAKAMQAQRAAEAAKKARELVRKKAGITRATLPGKLADCSHDNGVESEIFIVEGDSAGGSAKQARDRRFQAVLPLRGKILNAERSDEASIYKNKEIASLIVALGLGTKAAETIEGLRYDRVIILTDADVDGAHIRTLLLTFLFRFQRKLFEEGKVFVAVPPLYKITVGKEKVYCYSDEELKERTQRRKSAARSIQRFKGLGEMMPDQLWETTLNPLSRTLRRLTVEDAAEASHLFTLLMGDKVAPRRELIESEGKKLGLMDLDI